MLMRFYNQRIVESDSMQTMFALCVRSSSFVILLPVLLWNFDSSSLNNWLKLQVIYGFSAMLQVGLPTVFIKWLSRYQVHEGLQKTIYKIRYTQVRQIQKKIINTIALFGGLAVFFSVPFYIDLYSGHAFDTIVVLVFSIAFICQIKFHEYYAEMASNSNIAVFRRKEGLIQIIGICSTSAVAMFGCSLTVIILIYYSIQIIQVLMLSLLTKSLCPKYEKKEHNKKQKKILLKWIFSDSWRIGIGVCSTTGLITFLVLYVSDSLSSHASVGFLLSYRIISLLANLSRAPFYTSIPLLNRANRNRDFELYSMVASKSGLLSIIILVSFGLMSFFILNLILPLITKIEIVELNYWLLLLFLFCCDRIISMIQQLLIIEDRVMLHIINGGSAILVLFLFFANSKRVYFESVVDLFLAANISVALFFSLPISVYLLSKSGAFNGNVFFNNILRHPK